MSIPGQLQPNSGANAAPSPRLFAFYAATLVVFAWAGWTMTAGAHGNPAIGWMMMFAPGDFTAPGALRKFLLGLEAPIPPWLAVLEVLAQRATGSVELVTVWLYRVCMVGAYLVALALTWPSLGRLLLSLLVSVLFLWSTVLVHPGSPIVYDVVFPFLLVVYFGLLRLGAAARGDVVGVVVLFVAGFALALAELTRPFLALFVLPLLLGAWFTLRRPARFAALVVPVLVLAGGWHAHQAINHGQLTWSNHSGFNLIRAWRMVPYPELVPEPGNAPVALNRLPNLNTPEHGENSRRLRRAVFGYVLAHPLDSALQMAERVAIFVGAGHQIEDHDPDDPFLPVYDVVVKYANIAALAGVLAMLVSLLVVPRRAGELIGAPNNQMLALAALSMVLIAVTESGEEARFQISILPLLAAIPLPYLPRRERAPDFVRDQRWRRRKRALVLAAAVAVVAVVEVLSWGARREPARASGGGPLALASATAPLVTAGGEPRLRVAQFNIRGGAWRDRAAEIKANAACLKDLDLAGLAEVRGPGPFGGESQAAMLARATGLTALFAPAERRWWSEHFGNALLTSLPVPRWERASLPHRVGQSYRALLAADVLVGERSVRVLVTQIDNHDHAIQIEAIAGVFRSAPSPAILLADMGTAEPRLEPLKSLVEDPKFLVLTNQPPFHPAQVQGGYVIAKGFRRVDSGFCKGGVSMQPRLAVELAFVP
ncbi:MAG: hypothetical protein IT563_24445 [Alphaproteobacteria bacterium]|nr:hypothetical protein [Alphaproteobacteria bacterium]